MELTVAIYLGLIAAVAVLRFVELRISRSHQKSLAARGALKAADPVFPWMVLIHTAVLAGSATEVFFLHRPFFLPLAVPAFLFFLSANFVRWWVIYTLGEHWNVQIVDSTRLGIVSAGPFRFVRHPNYAAVFVEMLALPLIHSAWITAAFSAIAHAVILFARISAEERVLLADPHYREAMAAKPRFLPGIF